MKLTIPARTTPLTKFIRTLEGLLVVAANVALLVVPIITPALPPKQAALDAVILNSVTVIARSILKAAAAHAPAKATVAHRSPTTTGTVSGPAVTGP